MTANRGSGRHIVIDGLQFAGWSETVFRQMRSGGVDAVHATILYHGSFRDAVASISRWNRRFREFSDLIIRMEGGGDLVRARDSRRTAIILGMQNPSPVEDDISLIEILFRLGVRVMQLTYNNQSLFGSGHLECRDSGLTRMGREALAEMNRLGMAVDLSHAGTRTALDAIAESACPVAITHASPAWWQPGTRSVPDTVLNQLSQSGGMLGLSLYPLHLKGGSDCSLDQFCHMAAETADRFGTEMLGIGSDLCQGRPASALRWMRHGRWSRSKDGQGEDFPAPTAWFQNNLGFVNLRSGLQRAGFSDSETAAVLGENWRRFFENALAGVNGGS